MHCHRDPSSRGEKKLYCFTEVTFNQTPKFQFQFSSLDYSYVFWVQETRDFKRYCLLIIPSSGSLSVFDDKKFI